MSEYLITFMILAIVTEGGVKIFLNVSKSIEKDWYLRIGAGVFIGLAVFTFITNLVFYISTSLTGIVTSLGIFFALTTFGFRKKIIPELRSQNSSPRTRFGVPILVVIYIFLIIFYAGRVEMGSSSPKYWSYAISIARGNYPSKITWQPDSLMVYHHAPYLIMGSLHHVSGLNISIVHRIFSAYLASGLFLLVFGISRTKHIGISSILAPVMTLILVGGPVIGLLESTNLVDYVDFVVWLGAGVTNLHGMIYANYHLLALGPFLLSILLMSKIGKDSTYFEYTVVILLAVLTLSAEEVMAIPLGLTLLCLFIIKIPHMGDKLFITIFCIFLSTFGFFAVQNTLRDSLFTPSNNQLRYRLVTGQELIDRAGWIDMPYLDGVMLPNLLLMIIVMAIIVVKRKDGLHTAYLGSGLVFFILGMFVAQPGFPTNPTRLINYSYAIIFLVTGIAFLNNRFNRIVLILLILPQLITSHVKLYNFLNDYKINYYKYNLNYHQADLEWVYKNRRYDSRLLIIDEYPFDRSSLVGDALEYYGLFVPLSPTHVKLDLPEVGMEWFDAVTTLSPRALKTLKINTLLIKSGQEARFSERVQDDLGNNEYFDLIADLKSSKIYQVKDEYYAKPETEITFHNLLSDIPDDSTVYLDSFLIRDVRKFLLLNLGRRVKLIGPTYKESFDYYIVTEAPLPIIEPRDRPDFEDKNINFFLLSTDPDGNLSSFEKMYSTEFITVLKRRDK